MWTQFWDMHSGGGTKQKPYERIYIEASEQDAINIFYNRFGHDPEDTACDCCGQNYSISEEEHLEQLTGFHRNCSYDSKAKQYIEKANYGYTPLVSLEDYIKKEDVLIIYSQDIKDEERADVRPKGHWVWHED